jgi:hypothetical protein
VNNCLYYLKNTSLNKEEYHNNSDQTKKKRLWWQEGGRRRENRSLLQRFSTIPFIAENLAKGQMKT